MTHDPGLGLYGVGIYLPPSCGTRDLVASAGGDLSKFSGWENVSRAAEDDHPSTMATTALRRALEDAGVEARDLALVISGGVSRDYLPSWSIATEAMRLIGAPQSCLGFDLSVGCLGALTGLEIANGWLRGNGGGHAAIITAERWTQTIDYSNAKGRALWNYADGASACVVGMGVAGAPAAVYRGACFSTNAEYNGFVLVEYGGTRHPRAPEGVDPFVRRRGSQDPKGVRASYRAGYTRALSALKARFPVSFDRVVCNQLSPGFIHTIADVVGLEPDRVCNTGSRSGHVGSADLLIGARELLDEGRFSGNLLLAASTPFAFGAGYLRAGDS